MIGCALRQRGMLDRYKNTNIAGRWIHRAEEGHGDEKPDLFEGRERDTGCDHQDRAGDQQTTKIVARRDKPNRKRYDGRAVRAISAVSGIKHARFKLDGRIFAGDTSEIAGGRMTILAAAGAVEEGFACVSQYPNAEDALKAAYAEILTQRTRIGELLPWNLTDLGALPSPTHS